VNKLGNKETLVAAHPGNKNAVKHGVHSPRLIEARAAEVAAQLTESCEFTPVELVAVHEASRCISILEAIDRDLDERGLVDRQGAPRYLLNHRSRTSKQLEQWLKQITAVVEREAAREQGPPRADFPDYVQALQRIALGQEKTADASDMLAALKELLKLGIKGTSSYLERPAQAELTELRNASFEARELSEQQERR
jgi:hypothetical protein